MVYQFDIKGVVAKQGTMTTVGYQFNLKDYCVRCNYLFEDIESSQKRNAPNGTSKPYTCLTVDGGVS